MLNLPAAEAQAYLDRAGVLGLIERKMRAGAAAAPIPPNYSDLARLHDLVVSRKVITALEFGVGYSTLVIAHALSENRRRWSDDVAALRLRVAAPFHQHVVDTSANWIEDTRRHLPEELREHATFRRSDCRIAVVGDRICHLYADLPDVCPDFIYLDGPDPAEVKGSVDGVSFSDPARTVLAADLIRLEYLLLPGTFILVDGRTNNARFLRDSFRRRFRYFYSAEGDCHAFELFEPPLGELNRRQLRFCLGPQWLAQAEAEQPQAT